MRKADALIGTLGAAALVAAVAGVVLTAPGDASAQWLVTFGHEPLALGAASAAHLDEPAFADVVVFAIPADAVVAALHVDVTVDHLAPTPGAQAPRALARLVSPDGTAYEAEGAPAPAARPGHARLRAALEVPLARVPDAPVRVGAADAQEAAARAMPPAAGTGQWRLEVHFSGGASPVSGATMAWRADADALVARARPA